MTDLQRTIDDLNLMNALCYGTVLDDAIDLLKRCKAEPEIEGGGSTWWYVCSECHGAIDKKDAYCKHCGAEMEGR